MRYTDKKMRKLVRELVKGHNEYKWPAAIFYLCYESRTWLLTPNDHPDHAANPLEELFREFIGNGKDSSDSAFQEMVQEYRHDLLEHGYISFVDDRVSGYSTTHKSKGKLYDDGRFEFELPRPTYYGASLSLTQKAFDLPSERHFFFSRLTKFSAAVAAFVVFLNQLRELLTNTDFQEVLNTLRALLSL